ncbi:MAG: polyprenyl synthetase family protein [Frankiales bacterium]|nr:polyprenyl synthetase family protein [Frankiales bacterium]
MAAERTTTDARAQAQSLTLVAAVNADLAAFLERQFDALTAIHSDLRLLCDAASAAVLVGGKRLRPTFAYWGWRSVQPVGAEGERELIRAAASLELLHAGALVHDDLMDSSDTRRGLPSAHLRFESEHRAREWPGAAGVFGVAGAVLLGDLLLSWAGEMFSAAITALPPERASAATSAFDAMRTEVVAGQFLDALAQTRQAVDVAETLRVIEFKTSKYTVQRPLLLGAGAAGADRESTAALSVYGLVLGEAFQLRDDLLGVFGDPAETGKPAGDDLREGKRTLLLALANEAATASAQPRQTEILASVGREDLDDGQIERLREVLVETGARAGVEARITRRAEDAAQALAAADLSAEARSALLELAQVAAHRRS